MTECHLGSLHVDWCNLQQSTYFLLMRRQFESETESSGQLCLRQCHACSNLLSVDEQLANMRRKKKKQLINYTVMAYRSIPLTS